LADFYPDNPLEIKSCGQLHKVLKSNLPEVYASRQEAIDTRLRRALAMTHTERLQALLSLMELSKLLKDAPKQHQQIPE